MVYFDKRSHLNFWNCCTKLKQFWLGWFPFKLPDPLSVASLLSEWAQILNAATWHRVVQYILLVFLWNVSFNWCVWFMQIGHILIKKSHLNLLWNHSTKFGCDGPRVVPFQNSVIHSRWGSLLKIKKIFKYCCFTSKNELRF